MTHSDEAIAAYPCSLPGLCEEHENLRAAYDMGTSRRADAHEVYCRNVPRAIDWFWLATFATEGLAASYVAFSDAAGLAHQEYEVRPV